ncbi:MAG: hypothetical protein ACJATI_001043 [Halioglobus sp.]|jgi:hypothetical protein
MKRLTLFILIIILFSQLYAQTWVDCNEVLITVDDFNTDLDFENQPVDCGCTNAGGECTLVRIKMVETINGLETPVSYSTINFTNPITPPLEPNYSFKDYIDIYNPYSSCTEYQSQGQLNHSYNFSPVAPPGHELHLLICPGSEQGQMRGRFFSLSPGTPLAAPTNVQASDGQSGISVTFDAVPGNYYMAYRSSENCNQAWTPIDPSMPWPEATSTTMTLSANSFIPDQQFEYRVVCSDNGFVVASGTDGAWSEGDLGYFGTLNLPYTSANDCTPVMGGDCTTDTENPTCDGSLFTVQLDAGQTYYTFNINDFASDNCTDILTYENAYLDPSTPNGNSTFDEISNGVNDEFSCGTYIITSSSIFDDIGNFSDCAFTFNVECGDTTSGNDPCVVESTFSSPYWKSYFGGDGEDIIVDVHLDESTEILYVIGRTNSSNFYTTNSTIGTSNDTVMTFISAINPDASLRWSTLIDGWKQPYAIDMDNDGQLTLVGVTDNPVLFGSSLPGYDKTHNGGLDIIILKLENDGTDLIYSSYFGGDGNDENISFGTFVPDDLKVDFMDSKIFILGQTNSSNLPITNQAIDSNPGLMFACVLSITPSNSTLEYSSYYKNALNGSIAALEEGGMVTITNNADGDYSSYISNNAIEDQFDSYAPLPILLKFDLNYNVTYGTYIGSFRSEQTSTQCDFPVTNGTPAAPNFYYYDIKVDDCDDVYWYSQGGGFRAPFFSSEYILPANKYEPSLESFPDSCNVSVGNPLLKINFSNDSDPFIEYMLFFGYGGFNTTDSGFDVDQSHRIHFATRGEAFFDEPLINFQSFADESKENYFIFESDLSDVSIQTLGDGLPTIPVIPLNIKTFDNKGYVFGAIQNTLTNTNNTWTDPDGNINNIVQPTFSGGIFDGFLDILDNNELCDGCNTPPDTSECQNVALNFDGVDDQVFVNSPLSGNTDYTIALDVNWSGGSNGTYPRLVGFTGFTTEIAIQNTGELAFYNGGWRDSGSSISTGQWYNVTLRKNGNQYDLLLDGLLVFSYTSTAVLNFNDQMILGGKANNNGENFDGSIDNVRVWAAALTDAEIQSNFTIVSNTIALYFNFEEGTPGLDNSSIQGPLDVLAIYQGTFSGFDLMGDSSNYICDEYEIEFFDPCDFDTTPPLVACPIGTAYVFNITNGSYTPSISDFNIDVTDECKVSYTFLPAMFDCDDLGINQVEVTVADKAGNEAGCNINFTLIDTNSDCIQDTCGNTVLDFDGIDDRVEALSPLSGNSNYTISLDFKCENQTGPGLYHRLVGFTDYQTEIAVRGDELSYYNGSSWRDAGVIVSDDIWHNVILVRDGLNYTLYLDGNLISTIEGPSALNFNGNTILGSEYSGTSELYKGLIDNYHVMDYAVDDQSLCQLLEGDLSGNVLVYDFEDGIGSGDNTTNIILTDLAGGNNNGSLFNFNLTGDHSNYLCDGVDIITSNCTDDLGDFVKIIRTDSINLARDLFVHDGGIYTSTLTSSNSIIRSTITKYSLSGSILWQFDLPDSIIINDIKTFDGNEVYFVGQTLFTTGGKSIIGKVLDNGNSYTTQWINYYDAFYTFSNGVVTNVPDRNFNILKRGNSLFIHGSAFIPNSAPQESTMILEIDDSGSTISNHRYFYDRDFNVDPHLWRGFKENKSDGFMIFGQNNDSGNDGSFIYTNSNDAVQTSLVPQVGYYNDGYDLDGQNILLVGENTLSILNLDGTTSCSKSFSGINGLRNLFGPFIDDNGEELFYADGYKSLNDTIQDVLVQFRLDNNCIILDWVKAISVSMTLANNGIGKIYIPKPNEFFYLGDRVNTNGNDDIVLASFDSLSCLLVDIDASLQDQNVTLNPIEFITTTYTPPAQSDVIEISSPLYNCITLAPCNSNDPCDFDTIFPVCLAIDINLNLDQNGQAILTPDMIDNGSTDECSEVTLSIDGQTTFSCSDIGVNEVILVVTDENNNTSTCTAQVTIEDKQSPICTPNFIIVYLDEIGQVTVDPEQLDLGSTDNCPLEFAIDQSIFTCIDLGENSVTLTVTDASGNSTECISMVEVRDSLNFCAEDPTCIFSCTAECSTDNVNLSTGIDPVSAAFLAIGDYDANWTLIGSSDPGIQVPRPAFVLNPNSVWDQLPGSQYISAYPNAENNATNIDDNTFYEFEKCFCVCEDNSDVTIDLSAYVDNNLEILLFDSDGLEIQSLLNITDTTPGAFTGNPETTITTLNLANGIYCLRARLKNDGSQTMGMTIEANVSGIGLIENQCCKSYNAITGVVFQDPNCDGIYSGESYLAIPDWEIQLCSGSTVVESIMTDGFGYYSFNNIPPGDYAVKANNPDMNLPSTPLINDVIIGDNEVISVDFGFCDVDVCCFDNTTFNNIIGDGPKLLRYDCDAILKSSEEYDGCFETIVDWGDGIEDTYYGSYIVQHEYLANGEYEICIETVQRDSDGVICNTLSECRSICMTCDQECLDDYLYAVESYQYPDFNALGSINKDSDVFLDDTGLYAAYSKDNFNGGTDILIYKDGILAHTMSNSIGTQVSEIQVHDDYIYLTGSFEGGDMLVTSSDGNDIILNNNCYQPGACLSDGYVIRFNMGFTLDWAFRLGQTWIDVVEDITVINESEFAISGTTRLDADFDPNQGQETLAEPTHTIKSYVAKYSIDASQDLPVCDWVNTLYTIDAAVSSSYGLGITHDPVSGDIYCTGGYGSYNYYGNTSAMQLYSSTSNSALTGFSVPAGSIYGYVVSYDAQGNLLWQNSLDNPGPVPFRNNYGSDVEILNNSLFVGGLNTVAKYQLNGDLDPNLNINPIIKYGLDINEIAVSNNRVYLLGFVNDTYRNLAIQQPPGIGPQITSPLNMLFSVYDENLEYIKSLNPGGNGIDYGLGVSVHSDQIAICGSTSSDIFLPNHPRLNLGDPQLPLLSERDFFVGLYECNCSQFDEGTAGCCDGLTAQIKDDPASNYCCSISINNNQEFDISFITIEIDPNSTSVFESGQLEINTDYLILNSTPTAIDIGHISGSIPQGPISSLIDFCLYNDAPNTTGPIEYNISYIQEVNGQDQVACEDIVTGDCDQGELSSCASITNVSILCSEEKEAYYEVTLNVNNESGNELDELQLSGLPEGMSWSPCDIEPPIINTVLDISLDALQPGETIEICVRIYTNNPVTMVTNVLYAASYLDADGKTFCTLSEQELELIPCCDPCEDINIKISESSDCCYTISMNGFCATNNYHELNISAPNGVAIVNTNISINTGQIQPWLLCDTGNDDLCVTPRGDFFTDAAGANEITFCLSGIPDGSQQLVFDFKNDKSDILCSKTEIVNCNGGCVPEGFKDPSLVSIGLVNQKFRLECDQPPLILDCPTFSEIFIKGRFDCSEDCDAEVSTSVLYNGIEIKPKESDSKDGTWEIYLTDLIKNPGLYQIIVEGDCDGNKQQCTYSFEVTEDCFDCKCSKLNDDISNLWSLNNYDGCQIGISPNGLLECDEVTSYSFNANILDGPFLHNEEVVFNIPQSGMYVICMKVKRNGEDADCEDQICETYNLTCSSDGVNELFCKILSIENGDFSQGVQGSLHDNSNSFLPGWELLKGEGYFFETGGSGDENSGFIRLKKGSFDDAFLKTGYINPEIEEGESNIVRVFHDVKSLSDSITYSIAVFTVNDTIIIAEGVSHENIWESKMIAFPVDNEMMNSIESGEAEIGLLTCQINCEIESSDDDTVIDFDNVCIEIEKMIVGTENQVSDENIMIYPNPNRGQFYIEFEDPYQYLNITIFDVVGRIIYENASLKKLMQLNLERYSSGVYILKVKTLAGGYKNLKFIKIR